ncbi:MAG: DUF4199 domain-containing protein [Vicingaceae bacterium]
MKKFVFKYGFIGGLIVSLFMCFTIPFMDADTDMSGSMWMGYASMVVALSTIFIGIRSYRNQELGGVISFGKAFLVGLYIALIASTLYVITWMILSEFFMPNFMTDYVEATVSSMQAAGESQTAIDAKIAEMDQMAEMYKNPLFKTLITYTEILPVGILISLISAAILKRSADQN